MVREVAVHLTLGFKVFRSVASLLNLDLFILGYSWLVNKKSPLLTFHLFVCFSL